MNELDDLTLIMQGKAGDTAATNALWARHQNFIRQQMAKIYAKNKGLADRVGIDRDDLIVEGWFAAAMQCGGMTRSSAWPFLPCWAGLSGPPQQRF